MFGLQKLGMFNYFTIRCCQELIQTKIDPYWISRCYRVGFEFKVIPACLKPFARMLPAALLSRSNTAPQPQIWVLTDSDFLTVLPQAEQSWEVYWGATAITVFPYTWTKYCSPKRKLTPSCITNWLGKLMVLYHVPHFEIFLGYKIALILPRRAPS